MKPSYLLSFLLMFCTVALCPPSAHAEGDEAGNMNPQTELRISTLEEQIRTLNGKLEESQFQNKKLADALDKFQKDTEFRFTQMAPPAAAVAPEVAPAAAAPAQPAAAPVVTNEEVRKPVGSQVEVKDKATGASTVKALAPEPAAKPAATPAAPVAAKETPKATDAAPEFTNARDHYNYAFRLLNQTKYDEAAASFKGFLKKYPKDPLAGNASYWLGETFYIRHDYVSAADNFRQGFESSPNGPKAADNLLKLAMSLDSLKHSKEACTVLGQVVTKFGKTSAGTAHKAETEQKRIGCQ